jgi:hypothetical protein
MRPLATCLFALAAAVLVGACDGVSIESSGSSDGGPDPETLTPDQIADQIDQGFAPIHSLMQGLDSETKIPPEVRAEMIEHAQTSMKNFRSNPDAVRGFRRASYRIEEHLRPAREAQNPDMALLLANLVTTLNPDNQRTDSFTKWANDMKNRPEVKITGWYQDLAASEETIYVFLDVTLPGKNEVHNVEARVGDSFHDLELVRILGDRSGILLRYKKTGDLYEVFGRSWEIKQKLIEDSLGDAS